MKIIACYGRKWEPDWLVEEMRQNLAWVDGFAEVDCRQRTHELWIHEGEYRKLQRAACAKLKPDWVLVTSPDERWERNAESVIRTALVPKRKTIFSFPLKEMWKPDSYRVDGFWGRKKRPRLYPWYEGQQMTDRRIQSVPVPVGPGYRKRRLDVNIYHLKMIEPESRIGRAEVYEALDPNYKYQRKDAKKLKILDPEGKFAKHGYHYLYDEEGIELEQVPRERAFTPPYTRPYIFTMPVRCSSCKRWTTRTGEIADKKRLCESCWEQGISDHEFTSRFPEVLTGAYVGSHNP